MDKSCLVGNRPNTTQYNTREKNIIMSGEQMVQKGKNFPSFFPQP